MYAKIHKTKYDILLAVCDEGLIGKKLNSYFRVSSFFYKGERVNKEKLRDMLKMATVINLLGKNCVNVALEEEFVNEGSIIEVNGVPHAQVVCIAIDNKLKKI